MTAIQQIKDKILNHPLLQSIVFAEVLDDDTSGGASGDDSGNSGENTKPDPDLVFDETDPNLAYYDYTVNEENKTVEVTAINYEAYFNDNGNYNITVPTTLGGYPTVLVSE